MRPGDRTQLPLATAGVIATAVLSFAGWTCLALAFWWRAKAILMPACAVLELAAFVMLLRLLKRQNRRETEFRDRRFQRLRLPHSSELLPRPVSSDTFSSEEMQTAGNTRRDLL